MQPHHANSIQVATSHFAGDSNVLALLLGGSLAHGFAGPDSDLDVMIVVSDEEQRAPTASLKALYPGADNRPICLSAFPKSKAGPRSLRSAPS
jgi:hypothetical protein